MENESTACASISIDMPIYGHTPGPWTSCDDRYGPSSLLIRTVEKAPLSKDVVARILGNHTEDVIRSNARLIAAAPDLLAALDRLLSAYSALCPSYTLRDGHENMIAWDIANAAIAKARGQ